MSDQRDGGIAWTDETWNPVRGCSRVSEGCRHCYAETMAARFCGPGQPYEGLARRAANGEARWTGEVRVVPERLSDPLRWRRPRRVFVNSMSDLFHDSLTNEQIAAVFGVMAAAPQHTFQCLTKRPARMQAFLTHPDVRNWIAKARDAALVNHEHCETEAWTTIPDVDGYEASTHGRIRSPRVILEPHLNQRLGRLSVTLSLRGEPRTFFIHQLVAAAHLGSPPDGMEVCHRNGNKLDNRLANLRWGTRSENQQEKVRHGARGGPAKLTKALVEEIRGARRSGERQQSIADRYAVSRSLVSMIEHGRVWAEPDLPWPLPNVWLGVSVEDQKSADERIPHLLACPAAVRWVSVEPQIGPVSLRFSWVSSAFPPGIGWVVQGGESSSKARPFDLDWMDALREECRELSIPYFAKQLGSTVTRGGEPQSFTGKADDPQEWPERCRVREWPEARGA